MEGCVELWVMADLNFERGGVNFERQRVGPAHGGEELGHAVAVGRLARPWWPDHPLRERHLSQVRLNQQ